ncbi:MAG TPA: benzoate-CoA ligase family protein [Planctomycetota bacterium]|nr:benzoate-CoA ligase family protein [Planctomycetota bacterium]
MTFAVPEFPERFNMARYFLTDRIAEGLASKVALETAQRRVTYAEIDEISNRTAQALLERGIELEDRVMIALPDGIEFVAAWFGALKAGGTFAMVNPLVPTEDFDHYFEYSRAKVAFLDGGSMDRIAPALARARHLRHAIVVGGPAPGGDRPWSSTWEDGVLKCAAKPTMADTHREDVAGWLFTSGSTGKPKAAIHRHVDYPLSTECYAKQVLGIRSSDRTLSVSKLFFGYATGVNLMFPFAVGATACLFPGRSTPQVMFEEIARFRPTVLCSVPTSIAGMLAIDGKTRRDAEPLRLLTSAGEALPPELYRRWQERFGVEILDGIGSAEMFHVYVSNRPGRVRPGTLGEVVPGYEAKIVGPDGAESPPGEPGFLWVRGPTQALGYFQDRAKSVDVFRGEWCVSGDVFRRDRDGYFVYEGRGDDLLKVSGIWVSPIEIENCLLAHAAVAECCVVGAEDRDGLVKPRAFVVLKRDTVSGDSLAAELRAHAKAKMAPHKYPRWIEFLDAIPRGDRGKADRKALRARPPSP